MATIKSFTSLEQSRKLAEILPLESSDGYWDFQIDGYNLITDNLGYYKNDSEIPCWSLAALISIIPQEIFDGEYIINITEGSDNRWVLTYDHYENRNHSYYSLSTGADNLIDACVAMIEKLYKLNLL